jgi:hypothetical protein
MSALDALMGPPPAPSLPPNSPRTLLFDGGEKLHLQEDESLENIVLFSSPGVLESRDWLAGDAQPWRFMVAHPRYESVLSTLAVDLDSGHVYLGDAWPRATFDCAGFAALLEDHLARHRAWQLTLSEEETR